jgi:NADP-dependent 3-hydroxy acid dehydrogenase YdfG
MDLLKGRIAIVSGIGPGVGKEVAYALAREGADVVLAARTASALDEVALGTRSGARSRSSRPTSQARTAHVWWLAMKQFKRVDVLVNNAFLTPVGRDRVRRLHAWRKIFDEPFGPCGSRSS